MTYVGVEHGGRKAAVILLALGLAQGCSTRHSAGTSSPAIQELMSTNDRGRIEGIAARRALAPVDVGGYRIGPDDLLDVRIPALIDAPSVGASTHAGSTGETPVVSGAPAYQQGFRVNGNGEVNIPMLGLVRASGFTPTELEHDIAARLVARHPPHAARERPRRRVSEPRR